MTTSIAWLFGPTADPGVKAVCEQLDMWVMTWAKLDSIDRKECRRTWALAIGELLMNKKGPNTKGPIEATIAALIYLGWQPSALDFWIISLEPIASILELTVDLLHGTRADSIRQLLKGLALI